MHFDPAPLSRLFAQRDLHEAEEILCRMLEDIAMRLDMLQRALSEHAFKEMERPARRIATVAEQLALEYGVPNTARNVFLDNVPTRSAVREQFQKLIAILK